MRLSSSASARGSSARACGSTCVHAEVDTYTHTLSSACLPGSFLPMLACLLAPANALAPV